MAQQEKTRYSDAELAEFKELILKKLEQARLDYEDLRASISRATGNDTEDTSPTFRFSKRVHRPSRRRRASVWRLTSRSLSVTSNSHLCVSSIRPTVSARPPENLFRVSVCCVFLTLPRLSRRKSREGNLPSGAVLHTEQVTDRLLAPCFL